MGIFILTKSTVVAKKVEKFASGLGLVFIGAAVILGILQNAKLFLSGYKMYIASIGMMPAGLCAGYCLATLAKLEWKDRITIALETGIQNSTLTITIIMLTFPGGTEDKNKLQNDVVGFALFYSLFLLISSSTATSFFKKHSLALAEGEVGDSVAQLKMNKIHADGEVGEDLEIAKEGRTGTVNKVSPSSTDATT